MNTTTNLGRELISMYTTTTPRHEAALYEYHHQT